MKSKQSILIAAGAALVILLGTAASDDPQPQYKFGGGWVGSSDVGGWTALQIPIDPAGRTEALRVRLVSYGADTAGLLAFSGANMLSDMVGEGKMVGTDTAQWKIVGYGQAQGPLGGPLEIRQIWVAAGTLTYTARDRFVNHYTLTVYPAAADADGDGFPDPGATPLITIPGISGSAKRVPVQ